MSHDINEILANLTRNTFTNPNHARESSSSSYPFGPGAPSTSASAHYQPPTVSSPILSPPPTSETLGPEAVSGNPILEAASPAPEQANAERKTNLLNLLKFNQPSTQSDPTEQTSGLARPSSTSNSPAIVRNPSAASVRGVSGTASPRRNQPSPSVENPQDQLLRLLNRSQGNKDTAANTAAMNPFLKGDIDHAEESRPIKREETPVRIFGAAESASSPFQAGKASAKSSPFTYVNPFDHLTQSTSQTPPISSSFPFVAAAIGEEAKKNVDLTKHLSKSPPADAQPDSVAGMLTEVAEQADKQAQDAVDRMDAEAQRASTVQKSSNDHEESDTLAKDMQDAAKNLREELKTDEGKAALNDAMPKEMAEGFKQAVKEIAQDGVADSWESADAEDSPTKGETNYSVKVFNLPMRPYVSIDINGANLPSTNIRQDDVAVKVASFKKEFDQVDRTLASSTANYIVYAISKGGGFRVIRQMDGANKQVFKKGENRIFNVCVSEPLIRSEWSGTDSPGITSVLATGVNGSIYWTSVPVEKDESFDVDLEQRGFVFPPLPSQDDNVTTHQLKTRAKLSHKHPDFFAISRGKSIYIVWPKVAANARYADPATRVVNSEKYIAEHTLKIATAKAGKDFAFSADDSVIVSLDKAGRLKFWDIREHTQPMYADLVTKQNPVEIKNPMLTYNVAPVTEKSWPTSVTFVDKDRASHKNVALRYLLVGMRQNHTIQLWDLGLGRAVQELNFPQDEETDPICSLVYHPKSSIIVLGHPKRNSVFFIHLSAPRYTLPAMSQRDYIRRLAEKDSTLPRPDSTAIMSGIREVSFASIGGELRSLDVMNAANKDDQDEESVFELYTMHSRGVTYLTPKKRDLGWSSDGKVLEPLDAEKEHAITVKELVQAQLPSEGTTEGSTSTTAPSRVEKAATKSVQPPITNGEQVKSDKSSSKKNTKKKENEDAANAAKSAEKNVSYANAVTRAAAEASPLAIRNRTADQVGQAGEASTSDRGLAPDSQIPDMPVAPKPAVVAPNPEVVGDADSFTKALSEQIESLYKRIEGDSRVQQAAANANLDAVLRLVQETLTSNVEKNLARIVTTTIQDQVVPGLTKSIGSSMERQISTAINNQLNTAMPRELQKTLPQAVGRAMQDPETLRIIAELVSSSVASSVDKDISRALNDSITPAFRTLAVNSAQSMTQEVERRVGEQLHHFEMQRNADSDKIEQLTNMTSQLLHMIRDMNGAQSTMKQQLAEMQGQLSAQAVTSGSSSRRPTVPSQPQPPVPQPPKDAEMDLITEMMSAGRVEEGTIKWLQSGRPVELFDKLFVRCNPAYLRELSQIVALSVSATVTSSFDTHIAERLNWLEVIFSSINVQDPEIANHAPRVLDVLTQRLQELYMSISEIEPRNNVLGKIHSLVRLAKDLKTAAG